MTDAVSIVAQPAGELYALELWGDLEAAQARVDAALYFPLPAPGRASGDVSQFALRLEPALWWLGGPQLDLARTDLALAGDGALTAVGGGLVRVRLTGAGWRALLMIGGVFDAESPAFAPGCVAATVIEHVMVRLHAIADDACDAYVPASHAADLLHFWGAAARTLDAAAG